MGEGWQHGEAEDDTLSAPRLHAVKTLDQGCLCNAMRMCRRAWPEGVGGKARSWSQGSLSCGQPILFQEAVWVM